MSLALVWCGKEWRAQRGILMSYAGLVFASLAIVFLLVPEYWWLDDGRGALSLSWFVGAGVIGVVAFVAPGLVRCEYGSKDDQFVRRLPGALGPAFRGKLLFLLLAAAALPLLGLLVGEGFLAAIGRSWSDLFAAQRVDECWHVVVSWPWTAQACAGALLLAPWVWAIGTWLPGGRMALGGATLLALLVGACVFAVLRQCPNLEAGLPIWPWVAAIPLGGTAIGAAAWLRGRRGGGPGASAKVGLLALATLLGGPAAWFGSLAYHYHHPDLESVRVKDVVALTQDARFALVFGAHDDAWFGMPLRIDLQTGDAIQLGGWQDYYTRSLLAPWVRGSIGGNFLRVYGQDLSRQRVFDLATGAWHPIGWDTAKETPILDDTLALAVAAEQRATTSLRAPGVLAVWAHAGRFCFETPGGEVVTEPCPAGNDVNLLPSGHGARTMSGGAPPGLFDFVVRRWVDTGALGTCDGFAVRGVWVVTPWKGRASHHRIDAATGERCELPELRGWRLVGLFDDDHLLVTRDPDRRGGGSPEYALYRPADRTLEPLAMPDGITQRGSLLTELSNWGSLLPRDRQGRLWFALADDGSHFLRLLPDRSLESFRPRTPLVGWNQLLAWLGPDRALVLVDGRIVEQDLLTGERTTRFPRHPR